MRFRLLLTVVLLVGSARAQSPVDLIPDKQPLAVWNFNNGQEFPGATGSLSIDEATTRESKSSLKLVGDFRGGGGYVQAGRKLDAIDVRELSLWVKAEQAENFTLRLGDASGQTHQIKLELEAGQGWRKVHLPLQEFFRNRGKSNAVTGITDYEYWGGAKDGNWHGPATGMYLLLSNRGENKVRTLWLTEIEVVPPARAVKGAEQVFEMPLSEIVDGVHDWRLSLGSEFKGATGSLAVDEQNLQLGADFTGGGAYVAAVRDLHELSTGSVSAFRLRMKSNNARSFSVQMVDATGQTHQKKAIPLSADGEWQDVELIPAEIAGGEHWGGAEDGKWHDPPKRLVLSLTTRSDSDNKPKVLLSDIRAEVTVPVFETAPAFVSEEPIVLQRTVEEANVPKSYTGSAFAAQAGKWEITYSYRANLESPDNSYSGVLRVEAMNENGDVLESIPLIDTFGTSGADEKRQLCLFPEQTASARFRAMLNKAAGEFEVKNLEACYLAPTPIPDTRIEKMLFSSPQLGNLLFPDDPRIFEVHVEARKPLPKESKALQWAVYDYWGARQMDPETMMLNGPRQENGRFLYDGRLDMSEVNLERGKYYEIHAEIGRSKADGVPVDPFRNHTSFAILPEAITRQYDPLEIPFTARNWDNRITEFVRLTDRLGVRICGLWGGWSAKPPYSPEAPQLDLCRELGMGWLTTTPITNIERGRDSEWSEQALRQGTRNFLQTFGHERPLIINLGNEPHGTGDRVRKNVDAYRIVYQEVKKFDPEIPVVATSVEPNEEYFKNGYGQWCDAYDFHIYEHHSKVRKTIGEYRKLMQKYDVEKPIWSTELGLNSQGQPRHSVSLEVIKKFATFFAAGGENVSWFGLLYPDKDGKSHGSSGDSHNMFDCRYNRYAPRLDAVTFYHAVNAIANKKFVAEREYSDGTVCFLFRDDQGECLQIVWNDQARRQIFLPLPGADAVQLTYLDGSGTALDAAGQGVTLGVSTDPILLQYRDPRAGLPEKLGQPRIKLTVAGGYSPGQPLIVGWQADHHPEQMEYSVTAPFHWQVNSRQSSAEILPPLSASAREAEITVSAEDLSGEIRFRVPLAK